MNGFLPSDGAFASCTACGKVLESGEEICMHSQMCKATNSKQFNNLPAKNSRDTMPPRFPCDVCEKKFKRKEHLIQHRKLHTGKWSSIKIKPIFIKLNVQNDNDYCTVIYMRLIVFFFQKGITNIINI